MGKVTALFSEEMSTRRFVDKFGEATGARADDAAQRWVDKFTAHVHGKKLSTWDYNAKFERVAGKLLRANPNIDVGFVSRHAPPLGAALAALTTPAVPPRVSVFVQHEDSHRAAQTLAQAEHTATQRLHTANMQAAHIEATAAGRLASSQAQVAEAQSAAMKLEAMAGKLAADVQRLTSARTAMLSKLNAQLMHRFTAGGCVFTLSSLALEKHAPSYLASLANGDLAARKDAHGAITVENVTADELRDLCHFFETGERIGVLSHMNARAHALAAQYGSSVLLEAMTEPEPEPDPVCAFDPRRLDAADIGQYCRTPEVRTFAEWFAQTLIADLDPESWAQLAVELPVALGGSIFIPGAMQIDNVLQANAPHDKVKWHRVCLALIATQRWLQAAGAPPCRFSGATERQQLYRVSCHFDG